MKYSAFVLIVVLVAAIAPAHADDALPPKADRGSVMVADIFGDGLIIGGLAAKNRVLGVAGLATYLVAAPIIHGAKDHWDRAGQSAGLRIAAPAVGGLIGCALIGEHRDHGTSIFPRRFGCKLGLAVGMLAGAAGAEIVDWTLISTGGQGGGVAPRLMFSMGGAF